MLLWVLELSRQSSGRCSATRPCTTSSNQWHRSSVTHAATTGPPSWTNAVLSEMHSHSPLVFCVSFTSQAAKLELKEKQNEALLYNYLSSILQSANTLNDIVVQSAAVGRDPNTGRGKFALDSALPRKGGDRQHWPRSGTNTF